MDIIARIDAERIERTKDPMRLANPLLREARDEIERLRANRERWEKTAFDAVEQVLRLREALKPFVTAANDADGYPDNHPIGCDPCMPLDGLTVGDLRRARDSHGQSATDSSAKSRQTDGCAG